MALVAEDDPADIRSWSGTPRHMLDGLVAAGNQVTPVGPLGVPKSLERMRYVYRAAGQRYFPSRSPRSLMSFADQVAPRVAQADLLLSPGSTALCKVRGPQPRVFWSDATFDTVVDYYPEFSRLAARTRREGRAQEREAIQSAAACVYSSQWAADSAVRDFGCDPSRVHVVSFGANTADPGEVNVNASIAVRPSSPDALELLFIGNNWKRKGGDFAVEVARQLGARLTVIGQDPGEVASHVRYLGYLRKDVPAERARFEQALSSAHFLMLPTQAECTPVAIAEANAYGVPGVSFDTGGVSAVLTPGRNGLLFDPSTSAAEVGGAIRAAMDDYEALAYSSRREYEQRLNWTVAVAGLLDVCRPLVAGAAAAREAAPAR